jgi:pimeloyl-ACP methyl ester carboxylesterase
MQSINVSGQLIKYEFLGDGPVVVLVNNPILALQAQHVMADPLVKAGRRVLVFENHGPDSASMREFVDALAGLLDALELRSACLLGWSQGAAIIQELALARPDLAGRIVLLATAGRFTAAFHKFTRAYLDSLDLGEEAGANMRSVLMMLGQMPPAMIVNDAVVGLFGANPSPPEVHRRAFGAAVLEPSLDALAAITAPTLVIGFERDVLVPAVLAREVADTIKGARYVEIADATHMAPFTHTKQIMDAALPFLSEDPPNG